MTRGGGLSGATRMDRCHRTNRLDPGYGRQFVKEAGMKRTFGKDQGVPYLKTPAANNLEDRPGMPAAWENDFTNTATGAAAGAVVGALIGVVLAGPIGAAIGGALGGGTGGFAGAKRDAE